MRPDPERGLAVEHVLFARQRRAAERLAGGQPVEADLGIVGGDTRRIGPGADGHLQHLRDRRRQPRGFGAVALNETWKAMRCGVAMPPPSAFTRSMLRSEIVSAWSMINRVLKGCFWLIRSKTVRNRSIDAL